MVSVVACCGNAGDVLETDVGVHDKQTDQTTVKDRVHASCCEWDDCERDESSGDRSIS